MSVSDRSIQLAVVALEAAAQSCQYGASLRNKGLDPLAREYLIAAQEIESMTREENHHD